MWANIYFFIQRTKDTDGSDLRVWTDGEEAFLVCIYNVAPDQPYAILKAPITSTAQDIVAQVKLFVKCSCFWKT